jgi:hypothetical protein
METKQEICDRLIKEGIDGREEGDAVKRVCLLSDFAMQIGYRGGLEFVNRWCEALEAKGVQGESAIQVDFSRANAIAGQRYGTRWVWDQPTLAREIYFLRRAVSNESFAQAPEALKCICLNNLGNRMAVAGRVIEALAYWRRVIELQPTFGMALCNRARILASYAGALEDADSRVPFLWVAHTEASRALSHSAVYTDPTHDMHTQQYTRELVKWIESVLDVRGIDALRDPLSCPQPSSSEEELNYRKWCLVNDLFLNPLNDLGPHTIAASDPLGLPGIVVPVDSPHRFESFYDQMKQEYASARWSLYEGLTSRSPHFSDREVALQATEPRPALSLAIEKVKSAYRASYSLFDKISFFINAYMELGIPERQVSLRRLWRLEEKKPIRSEFDQTGNLGFCALFWLSKDLFEEESDEVAEPEARGLSEIRNHLEHKYLRVTVGASVPAPPDDLAIIVSREDLEGKALHLLKLARSALIYLAIGCKFEEERRKPRYAGVPIEDLAPTVYLADDEKK